MTDTELIFDIFKLSQTYDNEKSLSNLVILKFSTHYEFRFDQTIDHDFISERLVIYNDFSLYVFIYMNFGKNISQSKNHNINSNSNTGTIEDIFNCSSIEEYVLTHGRLDIHPNDRILFETIRKELLDEKIRGEKM